MKDPTKQKRAVAGWLDPDTVERLDAEAQHLDRSRSWLVASILEQFCESLPPGRDFRWPSSPVSPATAAGGCLRSPGGVQTEPAGALPAPAANVTE